MSRQSKKQRMIGELMEQFRIAGIQDNTFDDATADRLGVNRTDLNCIDIIDRRGGLTAGELASESGLSTGAVTAVIDRLERAGYARRVRDDDDRRKVKVEVTPKLQKRIRQIYEPMTEEWGAMMNRASTDQLRLMVDFMREANEVRPRHLGRLRRPPD
jgi:DNA-binding MarR family transcriptional regulator